MKKFAELIGWPWICSHDFQVVNKVSIYEPGKIIPIGKEYHLVCTKCCALRVKKYEKRRTP